MKIFKRLLIFLIPIITVCGCIKIYYNYKTPEPFICGTPEAEDSFLEMLNEGHTKEIYDLAQEWGLNINKELKKGYNGNVYGTPYEEINDMVSEITYAAIAEAGFDISVLQNNKNNIYMRRFELLEKTKLGDNIILEVLSVPNEEIPFARNIAGAYLCIPNYMPGIDNLGSIQSYAHTLE